MNTVWCVCAQFLLLCVHLALAGLSLYNSAAVYILAGGICLLKEGDVVGLYCLLPCTGQNAAELKTYSDEQNSKFRVQQAILLEQCICAQNTLVPPKWTGNFTTVRSKDGKE